MSISDLIKKEIALYEKNGNTRYALALKAGVDHSILRRFLVEGRDIKASTVDKLATALNLEFKTVPLTPNKKK